MKYVVKGTFIDTPDSSSFRIRKGYILVEDGIIREFKDNINEDLEVIDFKDNIIIPGMTDLHLHAPQYNFCGTAMDLPLLDWLNNYTFPEESKFSDITYAKKSYQQFVNDLLKTSTTRACIFGTIHNEATLELMDLLERNKLISYVGKVGMDRNSPDYYIEKDGIKNTIDFLDSVKKKNYEYVKPIITPRFTPTVTDEYMANLGKLAKERKLGCQSHLSENDQEIKWVHELRPMDSFYGESYDKHGLFGNGVNTIMAHCVHSNEDECNLMKKNGVYIAHCPTSNTNLGSGIAPAAYYLRNGFNVGIGSDVAGGNTLDLFMVMRQAIQVSKLRHRFFNDSNKPLTVVEAYYMATKLGGSYFGKVGCFDEGYEFDAVVIDNYGRNEVRAHSYEEFMEKLIYMNKHKIIAKYIKGNKIDFID